MSFKNKIAVITGGSSGIGLALAQKLAQKKAIPIIVGRSQAKGEKALAELKKINAEASFISTDVTKPSQIEALFQYILDKYGKLDFAFNNAANTEITAKAAFQEYTEEDYEKMMNIWFKSVWLCTNQELKIMAKQKSGIIVNTSSMDALICAAGTATYAAAKSAVISFSKSLAQEYGRQGIRINSFCPGAFETPMLSQKFENLSAEDQEILKEKYNNMNALGRIGQPQEAADVVSWLFSNQSSYITGQNIIADGGIAFS